MARHGLAQRTRLRLQHASDVLSDPSLRTVVLTGGIIGNLGLHLLLRDPNVAWATAALALVAGLALTTRAAVTLAVAVGLGHTAIDLLDGATTAEVPGLAIRLAVLAGLALVGSAGALSERQRGRALERVVSEDPITGLLNVRAFYDQLAQLRTEGSSFTILLADIRGMRRLNEQYGHPTGTEAMRALAHVMRRAAGTDVLASRLGSDEIAMALVGEDRSRCRQVVDEVIDRLHEEQVLLPDGTRFEVHAAYGLARYPEDGVDEVAVLRAADHAKELAKQAGMDEVSTADGGRLS